MTAWSYEMSLAGYIVHTPGGDLGSPGTGYTYILAGNGLFLETENPHLRARILLAPVDVRGLPPLEPYLRLRHGLIPSHLLDLVLNVCYTRPDQEVYVAIAWDGEYRISVPPQEGGAGHVSYETVPHTVVGVHSHGKMGAFFSATDDQDDQGFLVSLVLGELGHLVPSVKARLCLYGYFAPVGLGQVFAGTLSLMEVR